ncbi:MULTISPECIES: universal stress protein [Haloarcula]|uniref:universal stress protein n=1 Tax=Haloarcula TaxID=2237 RepID=UPI0023E875B3|nr:universal stress protein [Halomicroarcula sp. SHR3]
MYESILFPTDGSEAADAALDHAVDHARQYDATLHVLFVAQDDFGPSGLIHEEHDDVEQSDMVGEHDETQSSGMTNEDPERMGVIAEHGEAVVSEVADAIGDEVVVETAVLSGTPYERILDYADEERADLLVMGTHGRTGVDRYLLGSVTEKVVRTADIPVLTVRTGDQ